LVASDAQQSTDQRQKYLQNASKCVNHLEYAERLWDSASQLRVMLARLLAEQHAKVQAAESSSSGVAEASGSGSISAESTRNPTPAPVASTSRTERETSHPIPDPPSGPSASNSSMPPPSQFRQDAHYTPRTDPQYNSPQVEHYSPQYHQSVRYTQATAQSAPAAYMPNLWSSPTPQASSSRMAQESVLPGQQPYSYAQSNPSQLPTQPTPGPQDWAMDPRYWMPDVGENIQIPGTNFYPPPSPHGPPPGPHGHGPYQ